MLNSQQTFEAWLAGRISNDECRQELAADPQWLQRFETAAALGDMAKSPQFEPMPDIDTSSFFRQQWARKPQKASWWPQLSVGMSALALVISMSPLQLQVQSGSVALRWNGNAELEIQQQVNTLLASYKQEQQQYLLTQFQNQQQQQTSQLVLLKDYLTENEQKARRGDMVELIEYLNQQRQADWQYWQDNAQPMQASLNYRPARTADRTN